MQEILQTYPKLKPDDVRSTSMGASGEDIQLSPAARNVFPYSVECKNTERLGLRSAWQQAKMNAGIYEPALFHTWNRGDKLVVIRMEHFFNLMELLYERLETKN